jgi:hypothetical protein
MASIKTTLAATIDETVADEKCAQKTEAVETGTE